MPETHVVGSIRLHVSGNNASAFFISPETVPHPSERIAYVEGVFDGKDNAGKPLNYTYKVRVLVSGGPATQEQIETNIRAMIEQNGAKFSLGPLSS